MGHAGAWVGIGEGSSEDKYRALESAGVTMVDHPAKFGVVMKDILSKSGRSVKQIVNNTSFFYLNHTYYQELISPRNIQQHKPNNGAHTTQPHALHALSSP
jgi:hypothetical protein